MLKKQLLFFFFFLPFVSFSQTKKGTWSVNGKLGVRNYVPEFPSLRDPPLLQFSSELDIGFFIKKDNFVGLKASISPVGRSDRSRFGNRYNRRQIFQTFFRRYAGTGKLRIYLDVGGKYTIYTDRRSEREKEREKVMSIVYGMGLTYFINPNIAFDLQLTTPLWAQKSENNRDWTVKAATRLFLNSKQPYQTDTIDLMFDYFDRGYFSIGLQTDVNFTLNEPQPFGNTQVNFSLFFAETYRINAFFDLKKRNNEKDGAPYFLHDSYLSLEYLSLFYSGNWFFAQAGFGAQWHEDAYLFVGLGFGFPVKNKGFWRLGINGQHNYEGNYKLHFLIEREVFLYENLSLKGNIYYKTKPFNAREYEVNQIDYGLSLGFNYFLLRKNKA